MSNNSRKVIPFIGKRKPRPDEHRKLNAARLRGLAAAKDGKRQYNHQYIQGGPDVQRTVENIEAEVVAELKAHPFLTKHLMDVKLRPHGMEFTYSLGFGGPAIVIGPIGHNSGGGLLSPGPWATTH